MHAPAGRIIIDRIVIRVINGKWNVVFVNSTLSQKPVSGFLSFPHV